MKGFGGEIRVIVGFDTEGKLLNYSVLQHAETPGLGAKMQEWFRTDKNRQSVLGRNLSDGELKVTKDGGCHNSFDHYQPCIPERCEPRLQCFFRCRRIDRSNHIIR